MITLWSYFNMFLFLILFNSLLIVHIFCTIFCTMVIKVDGLLCYHVVYLWEQNRLLKFLNIQGTVTFFSGLVYKTSLSWHFCLIMFFLTSLIVHIVCYRLNNQSKVILFSPLFLKLYIVLVTLSIHRNYHICVIKCSK